MPEEVKEPKELEKVAEVKDQGEKPADRSYSMDELTHERPEGDKELSEPGDVGLKEGGEDEIDLDALKLSPAEAKEILSGHEGTKAKLALLSRIEPHLAKMKYADMEDFIEDLESYEPGRGAPAAEEKPAAAAAGTGFFETYKDAFDKDPNLKKFYESMFNHIFSDFHKNSSKSFASKLDILDAKMDAWYDRFERNYHSSLSEEDKKKGVKLDVTQHKLTKFMEKQGLGPEWMSRQLAAGHNPMERGHALMKALESGLKPSGSPNGKAGTDLAKEAERPGGLRPGAARWPTLKDGSIDLDKATQEQKHAYYDWALKQVRL
ncbi:MAG: hypothetical protein ACREH5_05035 [Candidatus Omnitrophota bacterium]